MLVPVILALLSAAAPDSSLGVPEVALTTVLEKRPVRLEVPFEFRRRGAASRSKDAVLFRVAVQDPSAFAPRGVAEPLFVYGKGVCRTLQSPFLGSDAIVLCAIPARKEPAVLWLTRAGLAAPDLRDRGMDAEYERASASAGRRALAVLPPAVRSKPLHARDADMLARATFRAQRLPVTLPGPGTPALSPAGFERPRRALAPRAGFGRARPRRPLLSRRGGAARSR